MSNSDHAKKAIEKRWHPDADDGYPVIDADHRVSEKPKKTRIRTEVAKQAAVSERRVQAVAAIRREDPDAYQRIVAGKSTIREEKAALNKAHREAIKANPPKLPEGKYSVIVIDPPWDMKKIDRDVRPQRRLEAGRRPGIEDVPVSVVDLEQIVRGEYDENVERASLIRARSVG